MDTRLYRSLNSGWWKDIGIWEISIDGGVHWNAATSFPVASNSDGIILRAGHTVSINDDTDGLANVIVDDLTIDNGATLELNRLAELTLADGFGVDLTVNGTLIDRGTSGAGINNFQGTWIMGTDGTIRKTGRSSVNKYRDNYYGGISNIPSTAHWYNHYDGSDPEVAVSAVGMYYPNLYMVSSSGHYDAGTFNGAFRGGSNGGYLTVKGNFEIGTTESGTVQVYYNNMFNASPLVIYGDLIIATGSGLTTASYDMADPCTNNRGTGSGIEIHGDLMVDGSLLVEDFDATDPQCATHKRILRFAGSGAQHVAGSGLISAINVEVDNSLGVSIDALELEIGQTLEFIDGMINTINHGEVFLTNADHNSIIGADENSKYINGYLRWDATTTGVPYVWTIGDENGGQFITLQINTSPQDYQNMLGYYIDSDCFGRDLQCTDGTWYYWASGTDPCCEGTWSFTPNGSETGWNYYWSINTPACNGNIETYVIDGRLENPSGVEDNCPNELAQYAHFSEFQHWSLSDLLPVTWLSFDVHQLEDQTAELIWQTADELYNKGFFIEHSLNGLSYTNLGFVEGKGFSNTPVKYKYEHRYPSPGINYYRLRQEDYDGAYEYSEVRVIYNYLNGVEKRVRCYPNPTRGNLTIEIISGEANCCKAIFSDITGKEALYMPHLDAGVNEIDLSQLETGTYYLSITDVDGRFIRRIIRQ